MRPQRKWAVWTVVVSAVLIAAGGYGAWRVVRMVCDLRVEERVESFAELIRRHARANRLPEDLVYAVIRAESAGDPKAVSSKNARGLMQITPVTEQELLGRLKIPAGDLFDPDYNIRLGTAYLRILVNRFEGDLYLALAAYNAGPTRIQKVRKAHPELSGQEVVERYAPASTARYCRSVLEGLPKRLAVSTR